MIVKAKTTLFPIFRVCSLPFLFSYLLIYVDLDVMSWVFVWCVMLTKSTIIRNTQKNRNSAQKNNTCGFFYVSSGLVHISIVYLNGNSQLEKYILIHQWIFDLREFIVSNVCTNALNHHDSIVFYSAFKMFFVHK